MRLLITFAILFLAFNSSSATETSDPYSLVISGGTSLGVYEAGVNWVVVEAMKNENKRSAGDAFRLDTVTGASAGAINSVLSALSYCESALSPSKQNIEENIFYTSWNIDLDQLMPYDLNTYNKTKLAIDSKNQILIPDLLFTRSAFQTTIDSIIETSSRARFEPDCEVKVGIVVTRTESEKLNLDIRPFDQQVDVHRFVIPLVFETEKSADNGAAKLTIKNYTEIQKANKSEYIFLPETDGSVDIEHVLRAVLASSAFPIAFSPIELIYCISNGLLEEQSTSEPRGRTDITNCPSDTTARRGYFTDGGIYDNIPLGAAAEILSEGLTEVAKGNFIFLDPNNLSDELEAKIALEHDDPSLGLHRQLMMLSPAFAGLRDQEHRSALEEYFSANELRTLLLPERTQKITGTMLFNFGAFLDEGFRRYDYAAGVHDGLLNVAKYICTESLVGKAYQKDRCPLGENHLYFQIAKEVLGGETNNSICYSTSAICKLLLYFAKSSSDEKLAIIDSNEFVWNSKSALLEAIGDIDTCVDFVSVDSLEDILFLAFTYCETKTFQDLLYNLGSIKFQLEEYYPTPTYLNQNPSLSLRVKEISEGVQFGKRVEEMIDARYSAWYFDIVNQVLFRLYQVEKETGGKNSKLIKAIVSAIPGELPSRAGTGSHFNLTPNFVGIDASYTGLVFEWDRVPSNRGRDYFREPGQEEVTSGESTKALIGSLHVPFEGGANRNAHLAIGIQDILYIDKGYTFSSLGYGIQGSIDLPWITDPSDRWRLGGFIFVKMLGGKLKLKAGTRDARDGKNDEVYFQIGISDFRKFASLILR